MFDAMTNQPPDWADNSDRNASDCAAIRSALAMTAAAIVFIIAAIIGWGAAFPRGAEEPPLWGQPTLSLM